MAKHYHIILPYCCAVSVRVTVDDEISSRAEAFNAAMTALDEQDACFTFVDLDGVEVDEKKVLIMDGEFLERICDGNVLNVSFNKVVWEEADG